MPKKPSSLRSPDSGLPIVFAMSLTLASIDILLDQIGLPGAVPTVRVAAGYLLGGWIPLLLACLVAASALRGVEKALKLEGSHHQRAWAAVFLVGSVFLLARGAQLITLAPTRRDLATLLGLMLVASCACLAVHRLAVATPAGERVARGFAVFLGVSVCVVVLGGAATGTVAPVSALPAIAAGLLGLGVAGVFRSHLSPILAVVAVPVVIVFWPGEMSPGKGSEAAGRSSEDRPTPVIVITVDTLRRDSLRVYDEAGVPVPSIERFSNDSVVYERAYAPAPWTLPSIVSILSGVSPLVHGVKTPDGSIPRELPLVPHCFDDRGYATKAIGRNAHLEDQSALREAFDTFQFFPRPASLTLGAKVVRRLWPGFWLNEATTTDLTAAALEWLDRRNSSGSLLWLHYFDPHSPYAPPDPYLPQTIPFSHLASGFFEFEAVMLGVRVPEADEREWIKRLYEAEISYVDGELGRLFEGLKELELYDDALIVLTSDHGEEFWEHDRLGHGHSLYDELLRVPLIIKPPTGWHLTGTEPQLPISVSEVGSFLLRLCEAGELELGASPLREPAQSTAEPVPLVATGLYYHEDRIGLVFPEFKYERWSVSGKERILTYENGHEVARVASTDAEQLLRGRSWRRRILETAAADREELGLPPDGASSRELSQDQKRRLRAIGYLNQ